MWHVILLELLIVLIILIGLQSNNSRVPSPAGLETLKSHRSNSRNCHSGSPGRELSTGGRFTISPARETGSKGQFPASPVRESAPIGKSESVGDLEATGNVEWRKNRINSNLRQTPASKAADFVAAESCRTADVSKKDPSEVKSPNVISKSAVLFE